MIIKLISLSLLAVFLSLSALVPATANGQTKDVKGEAALARLSAAQDANMRQLKKDQAVLDITIKDSDGIRRLSAALKGISQSTALWGANLDCSVAVVDKHNRDFPSEPWASITELRDRLFGKPDAERLKKANACVEHGGIIQP
jgi:hypothetical protein